MTRAHLEALLDELITLTNVMPDPEATVLGITATRPGSGGGAYPDCLPFRLAELVDYADTVPGDPAGIRTRTGVADWASLWAYAWWEVSDLALPHPHGAMFLYLKAHLAWAVEHFPAMDAFETELSTALAWVRRACGHAPVGTVIPCPTCGQALTHPVSEKGVSEEYYCGHCEATWTLEGLTFLASQRDAWVPRQQARTLLGVNASLLRQWIHRGQLEERDGRVNLAQVQALARR